VSRGTEGRSGIGRIRAGRRLILGFGDFGFGGLGTSGRFGRGWAALDVQGNHIQPPFGGFAEDDRHFLPGSQILRCDRFPAFVDFQVWHEVDLDSE